MLFRLKIARPEGDKVHMAQAMRVRVRIRLIGHHQLSGVSSGTILSMPPKKLEPTTIALSDLYAGVKLLRLDPENVSHHKGIVRTKKPPIEFTSLQSAEDLPCWLGVSARMIEAFQSETEIFYEKTPLRKMRSSTDVRIVHRVYGELAALQRHIARSIALTSAADFPICVQGFVRHRSIVSNAVQHLGKANVLCVDLQDFFGSVKIVAIHNVFTLLGCGPVAADILARLCTLNGVLPQGASTSPILANIAARFLDADMLQLGKMYSCTYSRYADDLTLSGDSVPSEQQISGIVERHGFRLNSAKTRIQPRGRRQYVTGLTVCDLHTPRVPRQYKNNIRLALKYAEKYGLRSHCARCPEDENGKLLGRILYVNSVEPELGKRLLRQYGAACAIDDDGDGSDFYDDEGC